MTTLHTIFKKFGGLALILTSMLVVAGVASAWTGAPAGTPPANNISAPINVGASTQIKDGGLTVGRTNPTTNGLTVGSGGTSVAIVNGGVSANQFCLGTSCISAWPSGAGGANVWTGKAAINHQGSGDKTVSSAGDRVPANFNITNNCSVAAKKIRFDPDLSSWDDEKVNVWCSIDNLNRRVTANKNCAGGIGCEVECQAICVQ